MGDKETGAKSMPWKDVSGQNNHATVYGLPKLVWDDTFPDGVKRKAVHFGPDDSIAFPDQSELGYDYSVFAVAGYKKRQVRVRVRVWVKVSVGLV